MQARQAGQPLGALQRQQTDKTGYSMKQFLDFVPILVFVIAFFTTDIYIATAALMIAVTIQVVVIKAIGQRVSRELLITFWASIVFGALTLWLRDEMFIMWKPTVVNWLFSAILIVGHFIEGDNFIKRLLGQQLRCPDSVWTQLNFGWAFGFFLAGVLNLVVAYNFSLDFWVSYKLIGGFAITLTYLVITMLYLNKLGLLTEPEADEQSSSETQVPAETTEAKREL